MSTLQRDTDNLFWDLIDHRFHEREVTVTMDERCRIRTVVGKIGRIAATRSFIVVDGWHCPLEFMLRVARATVEDRDVYEREQARIAAEEEAARKKAMTRQERAA